MTPSIHGGPGPIRASRVHGRYGLLAVERDPDATDRRGSKRGSQRPRRERRLLEVQRTQPGEKRTLNLARYLTSKLPVQKREGGGI